MKKSFILIAVMFVFLFACNTPTTNGNMNANEQISSVKIDTTLKESPAGDNDNASLLNQIGTRSGYIWESINSEAQVYATLAFDDDKYRNSVYRMNGSTDNLSPVASVDGTWKMDDPYHVSGINSLTGKPVNWVFSNDYSTATNGYGVVFKRIKVEKNSTSSAPQQDESNSIDGTYSFKDNSVEVTVTIDGNTWSEKTTIISGINSDYDEQNAQYDEGIVKGNDLYDGSGMIRVGFVNGNRLNITVANQTVTLFKQ